MVSTSKITARSSELRFRHTSLPKKLVYIYIYTKGSIAIDGRCLRRCSVDLRKARYLTLLHGSLPLPRTVPSPGPQAWDWALAGYPAAFRMTQVMAFHMMLSHYRSVLNCGYMPQEDVNTSAEKTKSSQMARVKHAHSRQASEIKTKKMLLQHLRGTPWIYAQDEDNTSEEQAKTRQSASSLTSQSKKCCLARL